MPPPPPPPPPPGPAPAAPSAKYAPPAGHWNEIHKFKGKNPMALLKHNPIRNDRSTLETTAKKSPAAGGMSMSVGGPGKFATVAVRTSSNHNDLPNQWSQDDGPAVGGAPMGLGGLFAGGIPRLPNKGAKIGGGGGGGGPKGPSTPLRPTALFSNGPGKIRNESPSMNGPSARPGGPPPPPSASTKPKLNLHRTSSSGENLDRNDLAPPPPPPSNKPFHMSDSNIHRSSTEFPPPPPPGTNKSKNVYGRNNPTPPPPPNKPSTRSSISDEKWKGSAPPPPPNSSKQNANGPSWKAGGAPPPPPPSGLKPTHAQNGSMSEDSRDSRRVSSSGNRPNSGFAGGVQRTPPPPPPSGRPSSSRPTSSSGRPSSMVGRPLPPPPTPVSGSPSARPPPPPTRGPHSATLQSRINAPPPPPPTRTTSATPSNQGGSSRGQPGPKPPPPPTRGPSVNGHPPPPPQRRPVSHSGGSDDFENRYRFHSSNELPPPEPFNNCSKTYPSRSTRNPSRRAPPPPPPPK